MRIPDSTGDVLRMHGTPFMSAATGMPTRALLKQRVFSTICAISLQGQGKWGGWGGTGFAGHARAAAS